MEEERRRGKASSASGSKKPTEPMQQQLQSLPALCPCCLSLSKCPRGAPTNRGIDPALPSSNLIVHLSLRQPLSRIHPNNTGSKH